MHSIFLFCFLSTVISSVSAGTLCEYCRCDESSKSITCDSLASRGRGDVLLRTVSLPPWVEILSLRNIRLPGGQLPRILYNAHVKELHVVDSGLESMAVHSLLPLPSLHTLSLAGNLLKELPGAALRRLPGLKYVDLSRNRIQDLGTLSWPEELELAKLDLSWNPLKKAGYLPPTLELRMAATKLERITSCNSTRAPQLCLLLPASNSCTTDACRQQRVLTSSLVSADFSRNPQMEVQSAALELLLNSTVLNLADTKLPASFASFIERAERLRHLNISRAELASTEEWKACGEALDWLDVSGCGLRRLFLDGDCRLRTLHAGENPLERVSLGTTTLVSVHFDGHRMTEWPRPLPGLSMRALESLTLSRGLINELPERALEPYPALRHLDLSHNQLTSIAAHAFPTLGLALESLDLSWNQLTELVHPVLPSLLSFDASGNDLDGVDIRLLAGLPRLQHLRLADNARLFEDCHGEEECWAWRLPLLVSLVDLDIDNTGLDAPLNLSSLHSMRSLHTRGNRLSLLDGALLPPNIAVLDAGENRIRYVINFDRLMRLSELRMDANPLVCDCSLEPLSALLLPHADDMESNYCFVGGRQFPLKAYLEDLRPCDGPQPEPLTPVLARLLVALCVLAVVSSLIVLVTTKSCERLRHRYRRLPDASAVQL